MTVVSCSGLRESFANTGELPGAEPVLTRVQCVLLSELGGGKWSSTFCVQLISLPASGTELVQQLS